MPLTDEKRRLEIFKYYLENGIRATADHFELKEDTIRRYVRDSEVKDKHLPAILLKLREIYTPMELKALSKGARIGSGSINTPSIDIEGDVVKLGIISDTHIGSIFTSDYHLEYIQKIFKDENINIGVHCGDVTEGMSHRAGHVYELKHIGFEKQKDAAVKFFKGFHKELQWSVIDGNHDRWFMKAQNIGADIVKAIEVECPSVTKIGSDVGFININGCVIQLWHGGDGSTYVRSYRLQKIVESISGGKKPNLLIAGHDHKEIFFTERNIHLIGAGSVQQQTDYMRGKRLAAHVGMWIVEMTINEGRIVRFRPEWIHFYS